MKITKNEQQHGTGYHCCDCGSHQPEFDAIQHKRYCDGIRHEQQWTTCRYCFPKSAPPLPSGYFDQATADLNNLAQLCWAVADKAGWHDEPRDFGTSLLLVTSEIAETFEEFREGHDFDEVYYNEDRPDKPEGIPIEMADALIRILHTAAWYKMDIQKAVRIKMKYNATRPHRHGGKLA